MTFTEEELKRFDELPVVYWVDGKCIEEPLNLNDEQEEAVIQFIRDTHTRLLERVEKEVIGQNEAPSEYINFGLAPIVHEQIRNALRVKQRAKLKEIITSLK